MAISSEGIKLSYKVGEAEYIELKNITEIPDLSNGEREQIEVTTLKDSRRQYISGLYAGSENLEFKSIYEKNEFLALQAVEDTATWKIEAADGLTCTFSGTCTVKLDAVSVGAAHYYTLIVAPTSELVFA